MSTNNQALVVLNNQQPTALATGGLGMDSPLFRAKPQHIELVSKSTRQEGAVPGKFRVTSTNEHFDELRVVLLAVPQPQREWYENDGKTYSKDQKQCFSTDNIRPHRMAKNPPAMLCSTCPKGDINWEKWRQTKAPSDLPPCSMYYHLFLAEKATQTPYYLNAKGTSVNPFRQAMETQMMSLLGKIMANTKQLNKQRGFSYNAQSNSFYPTPGFVPEANDTNAQEVADKTQLQSQGPVPMPNIFDIAFTIYVTQKDKGGAYMMAFKDFKYLGNAEERAEFGNLYMEHINRKNEQKIIPAAVAEQAEADAQLVEAEVITNAVGPIDGEYVKDEPIVTI